MDNFWKSFLIAMIIMLFMDFIWIGIINYKNYINTIVAVQGTEVKFRYGSAFIVYIAMALIIVMWTVPKVKEVTKNRSDLFVNSYKYGGLLGALTFAIFDFTNNSIFTNWSLHTSIMDTMWGFFIMGTTTYLTAM